MSEKDKLEHKILENLLKSSFPLEIECSSILRKRGWYTYNQVNYSDPELHKLRTIDIHAMYAKTIIVNTTPFIVKLELAIECKKTEDPWVFYTTDSRLLSSQEKLFDCYLKKLVFYRLYTKKVQEIEFWDHFNENHSRGLIPVEPFKKGSSKRIFRAANQSVKAANDVFINEKAVIFDEKRKREGSRALIVYPVIVVDGTLFSAMLDPSGNLVLEDKDWIVYDFPMCFIAQRLPMSRILVDVVTRKFFESYLTILEEECKNVRAV
jgi:hypothetical protein